MLKRILFVLALILLTGCAQSEYTQEQISAIEGCVDLCIKQVGEIPFEKGPCLSNDYMDDWVCDIVHSPRHPVDDESENQCSAFREGEASHFVELNLQCEVIRVY